MCVCVCCGDGNFPLGAAYLQTTLQERVCHLDICECDDDGRVMFQWFQKNALKMCSCFWFFVPFGWKKYILYSIEGFSENTVVSEFYGLSKTLTTSLGGKTVRLCHQSIKLVCTLLIPMKCQLFFYVCKSKFDNYQHVWLYWLIPGGCTVWPIPHQHKKYSWVTKGRRFL